MPTLESLVKNFKSIPYLFIGSGLSRRYLQTPGWEQLLRNLADSLDSKLFLRERKNENYATDEDFYMGLAGILYARYEEEFDRNPGFLNQDFPGIQINPNQSILKQCIAYIFRNQEYPQHLPEDLHEELKLLSSLSKRSIAAVITTNYDHLTRIAFKEFREYTGQQDMLFAPISGVQEVYKIHGSSHEPESIIITKKDYQQFDAKQAYLAAKLMTIFIEHPIVFLGYSLKDPNIRKIFSSIAFCLSDEQVEQIKDHLLFVEYDHHPTHEMQLTEMEQNFSFGDTSKTLKLKKLTLHSFKTLYTALSLKTFCYSPKLLSQLKRDIYALVSSNAPTASFVLPTEKTSQEQLLNGVTLMPIADQQHGFERLTGEQIYRGLFDETTTVETDIIESNIHDICLKQLEPVFKDSSNRLPLCYYLQLYCAKGFPLEKLPSALVSYVRELSVSDFTPSPQLLRKLKDLNTWDSVQAGIRRPIAGHELDLTAIYQIPFEAINLSELRRFIIELVQEQGTAKLNTQLRKLIRYYDYLLYRSKLPDSLLGIG